MEVATLATAKDGKGFIMTLKKRKQEEMMEDPIYCRNCDREASFMIVRDGRDPLPLCGVCREAFEWGQAAPEATIYLMEDGVWSEAQQRWCRRPDYLLVAQQRRGDEGEERECRKPCPLS